MRAPLNLAEAARTLRTGRPRSRVREAARLLKSAVRHCRGGRPRTRKHLVGRYCECSECRLSRKAALKPKPPT